MTPKLDIVGITEFAAMAGVGVTTMKTWRRRGVLPEPDVELSAGPIWRRSTAERWLQGAGRARVTMVQRLGET